MTKKENKKKENKKNGNKSFIDLYFKSHGQDLQKNIKILRKKLKSYIEQEGSENNDQNDQLISKLRLIANDIAQVTNDIEELIVNLDRENPVQLTSEDQQRINNSDLVNEMFVNLSPYFLIYLMMSNQEYECGDL